MGQTYWHITFGTYGDRLHGDARPTIDRKHHQFGEPLLAPDHERNAHERRLLAEEPVVLSEEHRRFLEAIAPKVCERGGWQFITCAAQVNHIHVIVRADERIHGKRIRPLFKRWLTQALNERFNDGQSKTWWAEGGSNKAIKDDVYLATAVRYVDEQRAG